MSDLEFILLTIIFNLLFKSPQCTFDSTFERWFGAVVTAFCVAMIFHSVRGELRKIIRRKKRACAGTHAHLKKDLQ